MSPQSPPLVAFLRRVAVVLTAIALVYLGYTWIVENPQRLTAQGRAALPGNPVQAERLLGQAIDRAGGDLPEALVLRAQAFQLSQRPFEALGTFSLIKDPSRCSVTDLVALADVAQAHGNAGLQRNALEAAHRPGPGQIEVLHRLIPLESALFRSETVLKLCRELIQLDNQDPLPWYAMALIFNERKLVAEAIQHCRESLQRDPTPAHEAEVRGLLAGLLIDRGDLAGARQEVDASLKLNSTAVGVQLTNVYLLRMEGHAEAALKLVNQILQTNGSANPRALMLRGILRLDTGEFEPAQADLEQVVELQPFNKEAHFKLGQACQKLNQPQQAEAHFTRSRELTESSLKILSVEEKLQTDPDNPALIKQLSDLYEAVGRNQQPQGANDTPH
ncbi:MAG: hypothetical protein JWN70_6810 [Planctomycetaceae bacterium]|nr:hypothetical protein [Planctomycetaceae bacterium]